MKKNELRDSVNNSQGTKKKPKSSWRDFWDELSISYFNGDWCAMILLEIGLVIVLIIMGYFFLN